VHARKDDNGFTVDSKEDCIRKSAEKRPSGFSMSYRIGGWMGHDFAQQAIDGGQELLAEALPAAFHTVDTLPQYPRRLRGGRAIASLGATPNPTEHHVPGDADWSLAVELIQPPVQLRALGLGQRDRQGRPRETLPKLIQEPKPLLETKTGNVDGGHSVSIPHL